MSTHVPGFQLFSNAFVSVMYRNLRWHAVFRVVGKDCVSFLTKGNYLRVKIRFVNGTIQRLVITYQVIGQRN